MLGAATAVVETRGKADPGGPLGHDHNFLEIFADQHAQDKAMGTKQKSQIAKAKKQGQRQ